MKRPGRYLALLAAAALVPSLLVGCGDDDDDDTGGDEASFKGQTLNFGLLPSEDAEKVLEEAKFLETYLESELEGLDVKLFIGPNYAATIESMKQGDVDFAYFGPFSYYIARSTGAKAESVIAFQNGDTAPGYYSVIYARNDAKVTKLSDVKGKESSYDWAFVDPGSTSGNLAPQNMLYDAGLDVKTINNKLVFAGGHDKSAIATADGQADIGASFEAMLYDLCNKKTIPGVKDVAGGGQFAGDCGDTAAPGALVTLSKFLLPASPIAARTDMDAKLRDAVIEAMLAWSTKDPAGYARFAEVTEGIDEGESKLIRYGHENFKQIEVMCARPELKDVCPKK